MNGFRTVRGAEVMRGPGVFKLYVPNGSGGSCQSGRLIEMLSLQGPSAAGRGTLICFERRSLHSNQDELEGSISVQVRQPLVGDQLT